MFRLLFWIAVITAAIWLWRRFKRPAKPATKPQGEQPAPMVRCSQCGVHVPRDKAVSSGNSWYCSQAHLQQEQSGR
ncbi:hypothetical protein IB234_13730 [Pseudomonas sp. PDM16]|uniref:PP0621 family protein n=1 Tax=Pseudomonas sp. PDM16 TaxID=2769292 RepID=UPI0017806BE2|nr:PP0621 family protein [Pseudomonas sp. PDM16]MBD9415618.1 hypothetical protein [Pseudomonas sp. PDM16]